MRAYQPLTSHAASLDTYLKEISRFPLLTKQEELELAMRYAQGEPEVRDLLINSNLRLVVAQAHRFQGMGLALEDLIAEGNTGLALAVDRFKTGMGASLSTYAVWWIRQKIMRAIENHGRTVRLPAHILADVRKIRDATARLEQTMGREPEDWELALELGTSGSRITRLKTASLPIASLDQSETEEETGMLDRIPASDSPETDPYDSACRRCDVDQVAQLLAKLPERLRLIIEGRFGIGDSDPLPLQDVGKKLGVTRERIRQLERKAMSLLRQAAYRMNPEDNQCLLNVASAPPSKRVRRTRVMSAKWERGSSAGSPSVAAMVASAA